MRKIILIFILFPIFVFSQENWQTIGLGLNTGVGIRCFYKDTFNNELHIGGIFSSIDTFQNNCIATWDGIKFDFISSGVNSSFYKINAIIRYLDTLYVGGEFTGIGGNDTIKNIAKWDGSNWEYITEFNIGYVVNFKIYNNELYVVGGFNTFRNIETNGLVKYNGVEWSNVYNLPKYDTIYNNPNVINDIAFYKGEYYIAGNFSNNDLTMQDIVKYNGTEWVDVGESLKGSSAWINKMIIYNNELIVGGWFNKFDGNAGNNIMKWDGNKWSELFSSDSIDLSSGQVMDLKVKDDELYISGAFSINGYGEKILKWDGHNLCAFGGDFNNNVYSMGFYRDTLYIGCGTMIDSLQVNGIAKWTGGNDFDTCSIVLQSVHELNNNELNNLIIYPNPTNGEFNIKLNRKTLLQTYIEIYNINGNKLYEKQYHQTNEVKINNLHFEKGVYFVRIRTDEFVKTRKLIIN